jgi:hypothetical protein
MTPRVQLRAASTAAIACVLAGALLGACSAGDSPSTGSVASLAPTSAAPPSSDALPTTSESTTTTSTTTTSTTTTTTTTIPLVTAGAIVKVANASNFGGGAGLLTATLADLGFTVREATNAAGWEAFLDVTKVYSREEARPAAESIARLLGGVAVERMPTPVPIQNAMEGLGDANVVVMLGVDLAGKPLPGLPG